MQRSHNRTDPVKSLGIIVLAVCMLAIGFAAGKLVNVDIESSLGNIASGRPNLELFWTVWDLMENEFVNAGEVDDEEKKYGAIKGLVDSYGDPATSFLTPDETQTFNDTNEGKYFEGIGAELGYENGYIVVISPLEGSPAKAAGIRPGDIILSVDEEEISKGDNIFEVVKMIRGESGTTVKIEVLHKDELDSVEIEVTRGEITVPSMTVDFFDNNIAYVEIARFTDASYLEWINKWEKTIQEILDRGSKKVILDLRGNPGGYFDAAVYTADEFLPGTELISIQENREGIQKEFRSKKGGDLTNVDVVVLVDLGSASASEILAGALQHHGVAIVVGEKTYGKGTAQAIEDFSDGSSLHVTVFKWLLPDGSWINKDNTIIPDYEVEYTTEDFTGGRDPQLDKAIELLK
jgi:carboxyl-terminal processing protease